MRARILLALMVIGVVLIAAPSASPFGGPQPNQNAMDNCRDNVAKQIANGVSAGGGPKEGLPGPTNCDHLFH